MRNLNARPTLIFCIAALLMALGVFVLLYPGASLSDKMLDSTPQAMDRFDLVIDMGEDYGALTVIELMAHYLENPPEVVGTTGATTPVRQFGGC